MNATSNLDDRIRIALDEVIDSPYLSECRQDLVAAVDSLRERLVESLPVNLVEMGEICFELDEALSPIFDGIEKNQLRSKDKKLHEFYVKVHTLRVDVKKMIIKIQSENGDWNETKLSDVEGVNRIVCAFLGIPVIPYEKNSPEWKRVRQRILNISFKRDFNEMMGLRNFLRAAGISSVYDYLRLAFGDDYDLDCLEEKKPKVDSSSRESLLASYKRELDKVLELPEVWPLPEDDSWLMYRARILNLNKEKVVAAVGTNLRSNEWFKSVYEIVIALYGEYFCVSELLEARIAPRRYRWRTKEETLSNVRGKLVKVYARDANVPAVYSLDWYRAAAAYSGVHARDLVDMKLGAATIKNQWYSKVFELLADVFEDWGFPDWTFTMLGRTVYGRLVESEFSDLITKDDHDNLEAFLSGEIDLDSLVEIVDDGTAFHARGDVTAEQTEAMVRENFERNLKIMGLDCPLKLEVVWRMSKKYAETIKFVKSRFGDDSESAAE